MQAAVSVGVPDFGPNVRIFDPTMTTSQIQAVVDGISSRQINNEMGSQRYSLLFKPGSYGTAAAPLIFQVGYYTEVAGLGASPADVNINGHIDVYNRCITADHCIALNNFWRSLSNLTINVVNAAEMTDCRKTGNFWAVSQASPMRRVAINGNLTLMDYCTNGPQWASGGFIADSRAGSVTNGSQQQFLVRDSSIGSWSNGVWNQVFAGVLGAPTHNFGARTIDPNNGSVGSGTYTTLPTNPVSREKPYLYVDSAGNYRIFVPSARTNSAGTTWRTGQTPGGGLPISSFFLARPSDTGATINAQLGQGKNLILTPGVYNINQSIRINRADTVVLGLGMATLTAANGAVPIAVGDVRGVSVSGIMIDAGPVNSPALMTIGGLRAGGAPPCGGCSDPGDPTLLADVFFRVGGPHSGRATLGLVVNSDNVVLDDIWVWRADHGLPGTVGWTVNTSATGLAVHGAHVTATGLFVEHFQKFNVVWDGEKGKTVFFQNEMPYDPPNQAAWRPGAVRGWAAYKVGDSVQNHELWGGGSYIYTNVDRSIHADRAFEVPVRPGVRMHDLLTVQLLAGLIDHVINGTGAVTPGPVAAPSFVVEFNGGAVPPPTTTPPVTTPAVTTPPVTTPPVTTPPVTTPPFTTPPGGAPGNLHATTTTSSVTLIWAGDAKASYDILRGESGVKIATVTGNSFTDSGLNAGTPYVYSVRNPAGTTPQISVVPGGTPTPSTSIPPSTAPPATTPPATTPPATTPPATTPPATTPPVTTPGPTTGPPVSGIPTGLHKTGQTATTITLGWTGPPGARYDILRGEAGDKIATVTGNSFTDIGLIAGTPYVYSVRGAGSTTPQLTATIS